MSGSLDLNNYFNFIIFTMFSYSLTYGFIESSLTTNIRNFLKRILSDKYQEFVSCYHCVGFWCSLFILLFIFHIYNFEKLILFSLTGVATSMFYENVLMSIFLSNRKKFLEMNQKEINEYV